MRTLHQLDQTATPRRHPGAAVRQGELARLRRALDTVGSGRGTIVELAGEPGIGKTRLLTELSVEAARDGLTVARARSTELDQSVRFHPLTQALGESAVSAVCERLSADHKRIVRDHLLDARTGAAHGGIDATGYGAFRELLGEVAGDGLVLLLDDFHWADRDTTRFVEFLTRYPVPGPLLLVIAQRTRQACHQLRGALTHGIESGSIERIDLGALTVDQSAAILGLPPDDERLPEFHRASGGNPLYLLALAGGDSAAPIIPRPREPEAVDPLATVFAGELAGLSPDEAAVAHAAAVLGTQCDVDAVATVAELPRARTCAAASSLLRRDVLRRSDTAPGFEFRHPLLADTIYAGLDPCWRIGAHRRAADFLCRQGESAVVRAEHLNRSLALCQPADLAVLADAAGLAMADRPVDAVRWLRAAVRMATSATDRTRLRLALATAVLATDGVRTARSALDTAVAELPRTGHTLRAAAVADGALLDCFLGHFAEAATALTVELATVPPDQPAPRVRLLARRAVIGLFDGNLSDADQLAELTSAAERADDKPAIAGALALQGLGAAFAGDNAGAADTLTRCAGLIDGLPDADLVESPDTLLLLGLAERMLARFPEAQRHLRRQVAILRQSGTGCLLPIVLMALSMTLHCVARLADARDAAREAKEIADRLGAAHIRDVAAMLESAYVSWTDPADGSRLAVHLAEQAVAVRLPDNWWFGTHAALWLASTLESSGAGRRCTSLVLNTGGGPDLARIPAGLRPRCFEMLAAAAVTARDPAAAADWATRATASAESVGLPYHHAYAALAEAHALRAKGAPRRAADRYRQGADLLGGIGMVGEQIRALTFAAASARSAGLTADADSHLILARELATQCGADAISVAAQQDQRTPLPMVRPAAGPRADLSALTQREREIAEIAGTGKRTRDIATELRLSPRTVDVHLTHIYRKLTVNSRAELARLMASLD